MNSDDIIAAIHRVLTMAKTECTRSQQVTIFKVVANGCLDDLSELAREERKIS